MTKPMLGQPLAPRRAGRRVRCTAAALGLAGAFHAQAQVAPAALDCAPGASTTQLVLRTEAGTWQFRDTSGGPALAPAAAAADANGGWYTPGPDGATWIGNGANGQAATDYEFVRELAVGAGVDTSSLQVAYAFFADDSLLSLTVNGQNTGASGGTYFLATPTTGSYTMPAAAAGTYPIVATLRNTGGPYGLAMSLTFTARCRAMPIAAAVPVDAPWALAGLMAAIGALAGAAVRRRRRA